MSRIIEIERKRFRAALSANQRLAEEWGYYLAREVQVARLRAEILSLKKVADRLDAWLGLHGGKLPDRGRWRVLATETGVTPEALYRELAKRGG